MTTNLKQPVHEIWGDYKTALCAVIKVFAPRKFQHGGQTNEAVSTWQTYGKIGDCERSRSQMPKFSNESVKLNWIGISRGLVGGEGGPSQNLRREGVDVFWNHTLE